MSIKKIWCKHIGEADVDTHKHRIYIWPHFPDEKVCYIVLRYWKYCPVCGNRRPNRIKVEK